MIRVLDHGPNGRPAVGAGCRVTAAAGDESRERLLEAQAERPWICDQMLATPAGCRRLQEWLDAGEPDCDGADLVAFGDRAPGLRAKELLDRLPPPVRWYATRRIAFVAVGRTFGAFMEPRPWRLADRRLLVVGPRHDDVTVLHELAHGWLHGDDAHAEPASINQRDHARETLLTLAREWGQLERVEEYQTGRYAGSEAEANELAFAWLTYLEDNRR